MTGVHDERHPQPWLRLNPRSIAMHGRVPQAGLRRPGISWTLNTTGYAGTVYPVNQRYDEVAGWRCYPNVASVPGEISLAYLILPAGLILDAVRQCAAKGEPAARRWSAPRASRRSDTEGARAQETEGRAGDIRFPRAQTAWGRGLLRQQRHRRSDVQLHDQRHARRHHDGFSQSSGTTVTLVNRAQARGVGLARARDAGRQRPDLDLADVLKRSPTIPVPASRTRCSWRGCATVARWLVLRAIFRAAHDAGKHLVALKVGKSPQGMATVPGPAPAGSPGRARGLPRPVPPARRAEGSTPSTSFWNSCLASVGVSPSRRRPDRRPSRISGGKYSAPSPTSPPSAAWTWRPSSETTPTAISKVLKAFVKPNNPGGPLGAGRRRSGGSPGPYSAPRAGPNFDLVAIATQAAGRPPRQRAACHAGWRRGAQGH